MKRPYRLSAAFVKNISTAGRFGDGRGSHGLSLLVKEGRGGMSKSWCQRLPKGTQGKREIGLGRYPEVGLAEAREQAIRNWMNATDGVVIAGRRGKPETPTFAEALEKLIAIQSEIWKEGGKTGQSWRSTMETYVLPRLGHRPVDIITSADVMTVVTPVWNTKHDIGKAVKRRIAKVMDWAVAQGYRDDNPVNSIGAALPKNGHQVQHRPSLPHNEVAAALVAIRKTDAWPSTILCLDFQTLTGTRPTESREAVWTEIDLEARTWTIPAARTKLGKDHRVPISRQSEDVLRQARELSDGTGLVFPSQRGKALTDNTVSKLLRDHSFGFTPHGMRSSLRTWLAECTDAPREIAEHCLGHVEGSASELAYRRTDYYDKRRALMEQWGTYIRPYCE